MSCKAKNCANYKMCLAKYDCADFACADYRRKKEYIKPNVDRIEWASDRTDLPSEVMIPENKYAYYMEVVEYLAKVYKVKPKAFRYRQNGLLNGFRDWSK